MELTRCENNGRKSMSKVNDLPEWTAQALVALGAVFLLISAYVMGVMVPNGLLAPNDFDANFYFEGDIQTFDLDVETGEGVFVDNVGSGSYDPTKAKEGGGATLNLIGKPDGDDYTILELKCTRDILASNYVEETSLPQAVHHMNRVIETFKLMAQR